MIVTLCISVHLTYFRFIIIKELDEASEIHHKSNICVYLQLAMHLDSFKTL